MLAPQRTTTDCDVMVYAPPEAMAAVEFAADQVAQQHQLPEKWLNSHVQLRRDALPDGWANRRVWVGDYGPGPRIRVFAASRIDLIAMKVLAGRPEDLEDLQAMRVTGDDVAFVRRYLDGLAAKGTQLEQIHEARALLADLETFEP